MADITKPSRAANTQHAEGDRSRVEENLRNQESPADRDDTRGSATDRRAEDNDWPAERSER